MTPTIEKHDVTFDKVNFDDEGSIAGHVSRLMKDKDDYHRNAERQAETNIAWYQGFQELFQHPTLGHLVRFPNPRQRVRLSFNLIKPFIQIHQANVGFEEVRFDVAPATQDMEDWETARLSTSVLNYYADYLDLEGIVDECDLWSSLTGNQFVQVAWDPKKGSEFDTGSGKMAVGDLCVSAIPIFNIYWGPNGSELRDAEECLILTERSRDYIKARYGKTIEPRDAKSTEGYKYWRHSDIDGTGLRGKRDRNDDLVLVQTLWIPRSQRFPRGKHVVVADGTTVLKNGDNPYKHGQVPVVHGKDLLVLNSSLGQGLVDDLLQPQSEFNRNISQQVENRELMANPFILAMQGSIQDESQWNNMVGGIRYYSGEMPQVIPGSAMPGMVAQMLGKTQALMQDISGAHDVSMAKTIPNARSGTAIRALQEKDEQRVGTKRRRRRKFWGRVGHLMLSTLSQFVREQRLVKVLGEEDVWEVQRFTGKRLRGNSKAGNYFDVRVRSTGSITSKSAQIEQLAVLLQNGFLDPADPAHKRLVFEMLEFNHVRGGIDPTRKDRQQQRFENDMLVQGQYIPPRKYENHEVHQVELDDFRKSHFFQFMPEDIQVLFEQHWEEHERLKIANAAQAYQRVQEMVGEQQGGQPGMAQSNPLESRMGGNGVPL